MMARRGDIWDAPVWKRAPFGAARQLRYEMDFQGFLKAPVEPRNRDEEIRRDIFDQWFARQSRARIAKVNRKPHPQLSKWEQRAETIKEWRKCRKFVLFHAPYESPRKDALPDPLP